MLHLSNAPLTRKLFNLPIRVSPLFSVCFFWFFFVFLMLKTGAAKAVPAVVVPTPLWQKQLSKQFSSDWKKKKKKRFWQFKGYIFFFKWNLEINLNEMLLHPMHPLIQSTEYTSRFLLTSYLVLIKRSELVVPFEGILQLLHTKASELVPCSLLPHWNSMRFFATVSLYD